MTYSMLGNSCHIFIYHIMSSKFVFLLKTNNCNNEQNYFCILFDIHYAFSFLQLKPHFHGNRNFNDNSIETYWVSTTARYFARSWGTRNINKVWFVISKLLPFYFGWNIHHMIKWNRKLDCKTGQTVTVLPYCDYNFGFHYTIRRFDRKKNQFEFRYTSICLAERYW